MMVSSRLHVWVAAVVFDKLPREQRLTFRNPQGHILQADNGFLRKDTYRPALVAFLDQRTIVVEVMRLAKELFCVRTLQMILTPKDRAF
jgi:hypothetical protein